MVYQTRQLLDLDSMNASYYWLVGLSTICSYNFHRFLTPNSQSQTRRAQWKRENGWLNLALFIFSLAGAVYLFIYFDKHIFWFGIAVFLTFFYSAPKIPSKLSGMLKKIIIDKTLFLALVWTYVTTILPIILAEREWNPSFYFFILSRFFLIYSICIIFDCRDKEEDKKSGLRSMITHFDGKSIDVLFYCSIGLFCAFNCLMCTYLSLWSTFFLILPGIIILTIYSIAKRNYSDYFFYFVLDGLMMFSSLLTTVFPF
jgi:4-hydroxybenzoate polyprenyltransferase